jgi:tRNA (adenine57-N1/adenine58-N1)-methyltransferase catalytic subunit
VLLVDPKGRRYLITLEPGAGFHTHAGILAHDDVIGAVEGSVVLGSTGRRFTVLRPTLAEVVLKMPRGAQVIYPKDLAAILMAADIAPGVVVIEAGVGSGALSMALLRAGAQVIGYELREDFAARAKANVAATIGADAAYTVKIGDAGQGFEERCVDRVLLDLPEPWRVAPHAAEALRPGGILVSYLPTVNQTAQLRETLEHGPWGMEESFEVLRRTWHFSARSARPDHRMVAHTGFITVARRLAASDPS